MKRLRYALQIARASETSSLRRSQRPGFALLYSQGLKPLALFGPPHTRKRVPGLKRWRFALLYEFGVIAFLMQSTWCPAQRTDARTTCMCYYLPGESAPQPDRPMNRKPDDRPLYLVTGSIRSLCPAGRRAGRPKCSTAPDSIPRMALSHRGRDSARRYAGKPGQHYQTRPRRPVGPAG